VGICKKKVEKLSSHLLLVLFAKEIIKEIRFYFFTIMIIMISL
jgi:hypothetical protein